jgi:hypothetical protein
VGRHAAADGAGTDPIVAAALARQDVESTGTRHATADGSDDGPDDRSDDGGGALGWPGDTTTGGGLGWPGSLDTADEGAAGDDADEDADEDADDTADRTARIDAVPAVPGPRLSDEAGPPAPRGWRRLFGGHAA